MYAPAWRLCTCVNTSVWRQRQLQLLLLLFVKVSVTIQLVMTATRHCFIVQQATSMTLEAEMGVAKCGDGRQTRRAVAAS